jgi:hypothetical protein
MFSCSRQQISNTYFVDLRSLNINSINHCNKSFGRDVAMQRLYNGLSVTFFFLNRYKYGFWRSDLEIPSFEVEIPNSKVEIPSFALDISSSEVKIPSFEVEVLRSELKTLSYEVEQ